jgi:hypothetical protein
MMDAIELASRWRHNKAVNDEWVDDYCARAGLTHDDVISERMTRWIRDDSAENLGTHQGYRLSVIQIGADKWRYAVVTPWGTSEGLVDLPARDDDAAITHLTNVIKEMASLPDKNDRKPIKTKKAPSSAAVRTTETSKTSPEPTPRSKRDRPRGSKDAKPRNGRTGAGMTRDAPSRVPMGTIGVRVTDECAWRPNGHGGYDPYPIWVYEGRDLVVMDGWFVVVPSDFVRSGDGRTPNVVLRSLAA